MQQQCARGKSMVLRKGRRCSHPFLKCGADTPRGKKGLKTTKTPPPKGEAGGSIPGISSEGEKHTKKGFLRRGASRKGVGKKECESAKRSTKGSWVLTGGACSKETLRHRQPGHGLVVRGDAIRPVCFQWKARRYWTSSPCSLNAILKEPLEKKTLTNY